MLKRLSRIFGLSRKIRSSSAHEIAPDEIFLDSTNLPNFNKYRFEGRIEQPISQRKLWVMGITFACIGVLLLSRAWVLQIHKGEAYTALGERNSLRQNVIFSSRGLILDRNGEPLVSNVASDVHPEYPSREYIAGNGFAHLLGYVEYPKRDSSGFYFRTEYTGKEGVEAFYNSLLSGENGIKITEENALGGVESESVIKFPRFGTNLTLSIDSRLQRKLYEFMGNLSKSRGFQGGAAVLMDVTNGEIIAVTSYPEFDSTIMSEGKDSDAIRKFLSDQRELFLDRAVSGLYTPGSIIKPFVAVGALEEGIINPNKEILSTGSISIPNPYNPELRSVFRDWKAHGYVDMREAIAVSSDVYFYAIGGGFESQRGLGVATIKKYLELFGFGKSIPGDFFLNKSGTLPDPEWKAKMFDGEVWRIGDTYNTSIGQYGMQVTPIQAVRATAALAENGILRHPTILKENNQGRPALEILDLSLENIKIAKEGMRDAVLYGTASGLNIPQVAVAAKTGTAEVGSRKQFVNSWIIGFFPYEKPKYAFVVVMERGPYDNTVGALFVMRQFLEWVAVHTPEYIR